MSFDFHWFNLYNLDSSFRFDINETTLSLYSLFWTNFWYLPLFFTVTAFILLYFTLWNVYIIYFILFILYFYEISDFWIDNNLIWLFNNKYNSINFFLFNNINKYHPFLFYFSVLLLINIILINIKMYFMINFYWSKEQFFCAIKKTFIIIFLFNVFSLYLGSWWAIQEGTWGGWWNWDSSETFGLLICLITLYVIHTFFQINLIFFIFISMSRFFLFFLITYIFIQLNFELISHNFGIKFFYFFNNMFFLIEFLFILIFYFIKNIIFQFFMFLKLIFLIKILTIKKNKIQIRKYFFLGYLLFIGFLIVFISFSSTINYFIWTFCEINISNVFKNNIIFKINIYTLLIIFILFFKRIKIFVFISICLLPFALNYCLYLFFFLPTIRWLINFNIVFKIHFFFFLFILTNFLALNLQFSVYFIKTNNIVIFLHYWSYLLFTTINSIDSMFLNISNLWFYFVNQWFSSFNLIFLVLQFITSNFFFTQSLLFFNNILCFKNIYNYLLIYIEISFIYNINIECFFILIFLLKYFNKNINNWFY